jgi:hypothetical protein
MRTAIQFLFVLLIVLLCGCYETTFVLGKVEDAKLDESLFGHWTFDDGPGTKEAETLDVSKFDDHRYKLEWKTLSDGKVMLMAGFTAEVNGALFVHAAGLDDNGKPLAEHFLIRVDRDGNDTITLSNLDTDFLATKTIDSDDSLRAVIEKNLTDPKLYVTDVLVGKRGK